MELVTEDFNTSIHRVHIIHALAECLGMSDTIEEIENKNGKITSEGEIVRLEKEVFSKVMDLRGQDKWPPK